MNNITILQGDITHMEVDAIVNAANSAMLGGGGVDGAIHRAAGPELLAACRMVEMQDGMRCPVGEARITTAGRLHAKYVIHTVGPRYYQDPQPARLLASAHENALLLALANDCISIAFPAISCGVYGYPPEEAARIALSTCGDDRFSELDIRFCLFGQQIFSIWQHALQELYP